MDPAPAEGTVVLSGDQQIVLSPEDAAQLLAQAGIQIGDNDQVIIGQGAAGHDGSKATDGQQVMEAALSAAGQTAAADQENTRHEMPLECLGYHFLQCITISIFLDFCIFNVIITNQTLLVYTPKFISTREHS